VVVKLYFQINVTNEVFMYHLSLVQAMHYAGIVF